MNMILKPFQLVRVLLLTNSFVHLTAEFCGLSQRILQVVMVRVFSWRVFQYLPHRYITPLLYHFTRHSNTENPVFVAQCHMLCHEQILPPSNVTTHASQSVRFQLSLLRTTLEMFSSHLKCCRQRYRPSNNITENSFVYHAGL